MNDLCAAFLMDAISVVSLSAVLIIRRRRRRLHNIVRRGFRPGKAPNQNLGREAAGRQLHFDYFAGMNKVRPDGGIGPVFGEADFERRFRMPFAVYEELKKGVLQIDNYFSQRRDAIGAQGATTDQKLCSALRQLSLGVAADAVVEYVRLSESTNSECLKRFCRAVKMKFKAEYLRPPLEAEIVDIEGRYAELGFPGCLGCLDCASWYWNNCPVAQHGQYKRGDRKSACRMEVICDDQLYIWHCFFGVPGAKNDLNILNASPFFNAVRMGNWPPFRPVLNVAGHSVNWYYWLVDGIYPRFRIFVPSFREPANEKQKLFSKC
jgi:Plant transposon protein